MNINKTFFVETSPDGKTRFYNVGKRFFTGKRNSGGLMERFDADESGEKNYYITKLKKDGWLPLSIEDIKKIRANEIGLVTVYPFKYRKGYMTLDKIEELARDKDIKWERKDHFTNPFSALKDYTDFVYALPDDEDDRKFFKRQLAAFTDKLRDIGAIETIEDFITVCGLVPDPRRFNKTVKELWRYYKQHLNECGRMILSAHLLLPDDIFNLDDLMTNLEEINPLRSLISNEAYEQWLMRNTNNS